jgi:hypothetical protein
MRRAIQRLVDAAVPGLPRVLCGEPIAFLMGCNLKRALGAAAMAVDARVRFLS